MKKVLVIVGCLALLTTAVWARGQQSGGGTTGGGTAPAAAPYTAQELMQFSIDVSKIPAAKKSTTVYLGASIRGLENPYIATIWEGTQMFGRWLDSIGQKNTPQVLDSGGSNDKEVNNMRQFAAMAGGNALAYSDPNENSIAYPLAEAMGSGGGYIGTAWNKPADVGPEDLTPNWIMHTSPDNIINGYNTAKALFDFMGGNGKVFVLEGMLGNTASIDRVAGFVKAKGEYPNITVARQDTANWDSTQALRLVETWLNTDPDVKGIWCANDNMATGTLQALTGKGLKGKVGVTGVDANTDIVEAVRDGNAVATVSSNGYLQGAYTLAICYAAWIGQLDVTRLPPNFREFATPALLINKANAASYLSSKPNFDFTKPLYGAFKAD
jgi:ribose transport system substrate-binding protein